MIHTKGSRGAHPAMILLGALTIHLVALVHGLPAVGMNDLIVEQRRASVSALNLDPRQTIPEPLAQFPSGLLNQFLQVISTLPEGAAALDAAGKVLTPLQQSLADAVGIDTTRDDLEQNDSCADVTVIFARGTTEPGNVGLVTGPPFFDALSEQLGNRSLAVQGVEYPATFAGFNLNGTEGVPSMTAFINQAIASCPDSKVVMSGYSQGALVVRSTAASLPADTMSQVSSVVTFGDPRNQTSITGAEGKTLIICHQNDAVCSGGFITIDHLTYGEDATTAAQFVIQQAGSLFLARAFTGVKLFVDALSFTDRLRDYQAELKMASQSFGSRLNKISRDMEQETVQLQYWATYNQASIHKHLQIIEQRITEERVSRVEVLEKLNQNAGSAKPGFVVHVPHVVFPY
ncbi:Nn.00g052930.m01.CDS01 [Neocucurbitaria sp. VM-36]